MLCVKDTEREEMNHCPYLFTLVMDGSTAQRDKTQTYKGLVIDDMHTHTVGWPFNVIRNGDHRGLGGGRKCFCKKNKKK